MTTRYIIKNLSRKKIKASSSIKRRISEAESLLQISLHLNSSLRLEEVIEIVVDQGMRVVQAEAGTLWLVDEESDVIVPFVARGPKSEQLRGRFLKKGEGIAGQVVESGEPILVSDVKGDKRWASHFDQVSGFITRSILCVPLKNKDKINGCLQFVNKQQNRLFTKDDLRICTAFSSQASVVIDNSCLYTNQEKFLSSLIRTLCSTIDARDKYTRGHSERVSFFSLLMADELGIDCKTKQTIEWSALLHDIGKIGIRDNVLLQEGPLNSNEWLLMKKHPVIGADIVDEMKPSFFLKEIREGILYHHEKYDGSGYPFGLKEDEIPLVARILAVADTFDAITSDRPYRKGKSPGEALEELQKCAGKMFDPSLVDIFIKGLKKNLNDT